MSWTELFALLGCGTILMSAVAFLSRSIVLQLLSRDLEAHKARLKATHDLEAERFRNELRMRAFEYETKYKTLNEDVYRTLKETYPLLWDFYATVKDYTAFMQMVPADPADRAKKRGRIDETRSVCVSYIYRHRILYPRPLFKKLESLCKDLHKVTTLFIVNEDNPGTDRVQSGLELLNKIEREADPLFNEMCDDFQKNLGFELLEASLGGAVPNRSIVAEAKT